MYPRPRPDVSTLPKRLSVRRKAVTMAIGFLCRDGVVIGADRQITGNHYTFPECKIITFRWANGEGILAYSGNRDTFIAFAAELATRVTNDLHMQIQDVKQLLKDCLEATLQKKEIFMTIFGFWIDNQPWMIMSNSTRRVIDVPGCEVIGYGDSALARSLLGRMRSSVHIQVSVQQARIYAVDFISQAKKYDGEFVGGGTDVYSITYDEQGQRTTYVMDPAGTSTWEQEIELMHYWQDALFGNLTDADRPLYLDQFMERLRRFRAWCAPEESRDK